MRWKALLVVVVIAVIVLSTSTAFYIIVTVYFLSSAIGMDTQHMSMLQHHFVWRYSTSVCSDVHGVNSNP